MAILTVQRPSASGSKITLAAAGVGGDSFRNDGSTYFRVRNAGAGAVEVTFQSTAACSFGVTSDDHDRVVSVPNDSDVYEIGPFDQNRFGTTVQVNYDGVTGVTVAAVR